VKRHTADTAIAHDDAVQSVTIIVDVETPGASGPITRPIDHATRKSDLLLRTGE
jgi:hypothetical protein